MIHPNRPLVRVIGLGNIGLRHVQGLAPIAGEIFLRAEDRNDMAVNQVEKLWMGLPQAKGDFKASPNALGEQADLTIIATSAKGREDIFRSSVAAGSRLFVLEKVAFTSMAAFVRVEEIAAREKVTAHVNTARRMWPLYQNLRAKIIEVGGPLNLNIRGRNLGMACNGVHYIDLLQMLSGDTAVNMVKVVMSPPWESKRAGYYELWGNARFETQSGSSLGLSVQEDDPETPSMTLRFGGQTFQIDESKGIVADEDGRILKDWGPAPYQSELSSHYARALLAREACPLPLIAESRTAHDALFQAITPAFEAAHLVNGEGLPIT